MTGPVVIYWKGTKKEGCAMRATTLCYIERGNQYLMLHRVKKKNDMNHDKWIGIGGGIEPGESPEQCLLREAEEETGLTLTEYRYRGIIHFRSDGYEDEDMHLFTCTAWTGEQKVCDEGNLEWIDKSRLMELTLWEGDRIFLKLLEDNAPCFELTLQYHGDRLAAAILNGEVIA